MLLRLLLTLRCTAFAAMACLALAGCKDEKPTGLTIAVIPKGTTHEYWKSVQAGAQKACDEAGVKMLWKGTQLETDKDGQSKIVEQFVTDGVSGMVLAPLDHQALVPPVKSAMGKKIPVIIIDSALDGVAGTDFTSYVATDNKKAGQLGGEQLAKLLGNKGKTVMLRYGDGRGSASTDARESGFLEAAKKAGLQSVSDNQYGGGTLGESKTKAQSMMDAIKGVDGVFCPNESTTLGMLGALQEAKLAGKIKFVGFDATPALVEAIKNGDIQALVAQDPTRMGYLGVKAAIAAIKGDKVDTVIDTGVHVITKENLDSPEIKALLGG